MKEEDRFMNWLGNSGLKYEYFMGGFDMRKIYKAYISDTHVCEDKTVNIKWYHKGKLEKDERC